MSADLVFAGDDGELFTTSLVIADETGNEHASVIRLIRTHRDDLNEVGRVRFEIRPFETAGGTQRREVAELDEPAAALLITNLRGGTVVFDFRKRLVGGFYAMRQQLAARPAVALPGRRELALMVIDAEDRADREQAARIEAEQRTAELAPSAAAWDGLAEAGSDYAVDDAAKVLSRDPNINIGKLRLFAYMAGLGWVYRGHRSRWRAYQSQVDIGRLAEKVGRPYWCDTLEKLVTPEPTIRITSKGLADLYQKLGGGTQLELVASS